MNSIRAMAGLLTYSPFALPSHPDKIGTVANELAMVMELTAAGQSGIYTRFPFNHPDYIVGTNQKRCKCICWNAETQID
jgi:hypothetical protein